MTRLPKQRLNHFTRRSLALYLLFFMGGIRTPVCGQQIDSGDAVYLQQVKPLLEEKCITCHGALRAESGLRLDAIQLIRQGADSGSVISKVDPASSELLVRVSTDDLDMRMPPEGEGTPLTLAQKQLLESWMEAGSPGPIEEEYLSNPREHWAFRPLVRPDLDSTALTAASAIDAIIDQEQRAHGLSPVAPADDAVWLRRVTLDLTGIPPTPRDLAAFQRDRSAKRKLNVVDRLLADAGYGQRWGRHWMDVWRYSDWDGYKKEVRGSQRHIWHWRDWIIESLNANKPYDRMIVEMLAGDEIAPTDPQVLRATGFLARNYHKSNRDIWLDAAVEHTSKAFLGLTVACAKCHDHKYDPIAQRNYYQFRAIFEPHQVRTDQWPGEADTLKAGLPRAYDAEPQALTYVYQRGDAKHPLKEDPVEAGVVDWIPAKFDIGPVDLPLVSYYPELSPTVRDNLLSEKEAAVAAARRELETQLLGTTGEAPADIVLPARQELRPTADLKLQVAEADLSSFAARYAADWAKFNEEDADRISELARDAVAAEQHHARLQAELNVLLQQHALAAAKSSSENEPAQRDGAIDAATKALNEAEEKLATFADAPANLSGEYAPVGKPFPSRTTGRRLALARWIVDCQNPLTARVAVNHIWMRHFGRPLVDNVFDFGLKTPKPKLVKLLDWLAVELIQSGWDMKHLHRLIVLSDAYGRASNYSDSQNGNENVDPDNELLWKFDVQRLDSEQIRDSLLAVAGELDGSLSGPDIDYELGETVSRRSLYFRHAYEKQMQMMVLFDAASPNECYRRRPSILPQQALVLFNSSLARSMSRRLAARISQSLSDPSSASEYAHRLFLTTLSRAPSDEELQRCESFLVRQSHLFESEIGLTPFDGVAKTQVPASESAPMRARESLALVLFNHNDFVSVR